MPYLVVIIGFWLLLKTAIWTSDASSKKSNELQKAIRYSEYDLTYTDKVANVIALGAKVVERYSSTSLIVPTKGFWQFSTNPSVRQKLKQRMASESFKDYLKINYPEIVFSSIQVQRNCLVMVGKKPYIHRRRQWP